ncbi:hypothetical protein [Chryseobacterium candidae]|uniref:Heavy-metal-associated domain-containing protein n=1 Tax=Chryseobacterium candidae TaxID=1978493 RepID=A0ABY2RAI0_9FLAO|nr:hypothetical protein [Chryseobacterium candidae]THV61977.1 hypothetical protein EK417_07165 [Chryseobacterium candidae]
MERKYHFSFEQRTFNGVVESGIPNNESIKKLINQLGGKNITYPCNNTIIFTYKDEKFDMNTFKDEISKYFYFTLSLIATDREDTYVSNSNPETNINPSKKIEERINLGKMFK